MGSTARVLAHGVGARALEDAASELARLERLWSRFRPHSDVARLNRSAGLHPVLVDRDTLALLQRACLLWRETGGLFDPTVLHALERNGYDESFERVRARRRRVVSMPARQPTLTFALDHEAEVGGVEPEPARGCGGIEIDVAAGVVALPPGVAVDLGGVGKGYAADLVSAQLMASGATTVCVGMGGDLRCRGLGPDDGGWDLTVEDPFDASRPLVTVRLRDAAIVTSTTLLRRWVHRDRVRHHLIDPSTGRPVDNGCVAAIVSDVDAWRAEGLAKAAVVAGLRDGLALLDEAQVGGWIVRSDGTAHAAAIGVEEACA
jgi:thiamine biosynthesis lipoprotein